MVCSYNAGRQLEEARLLACLPGGGHVARGERLLTHSMRSQQSVSTVLYLESNMCTDPNYGFLSKKYPTSQNYSQIVHTEALAALGSAHADNLTFCGDSSPPSKSVRGSLIGKKCGGIGESKHLFWQLVAKPRASHSGNVKLSTPLVARVSRCPIVHDFLRRALVRGVVVASRRHCLQHCI